LITIVPSVGSTNGVVFTTKLPSTSLSPASVKSPLTGISSGVVSFSLSTIGSSLTGVTSTKIVSLTHIAGNGVPSSQISTTIVS